MSGYTRLTMIQGTKSKAPRILCVVLALGCGGKAEVQASAGGATSSGAATSAGGSSGVVGGLPPTGGQNGSGDAAGAASGGAAGTASGGTAGASGSAGSPTGGTGGDAGSGGGCFKTLCDLVRAPTCKDIDTLTNYTQPSLAEAPCGASCIFIPVDTPCGAGKHCDQSTNMDAACVPDSGNNCASGQMGYEAYRSTLIASDNSCQTEADCSFVPEINQCAYSCGIAVSASKTALVVEGLGAYASNDCAACPAPTPPQCNPFYLACNEGKCTIPPFIPPLPPAP